MAKNSVLITGGNKGLGLEAGRRLGEQSRTVFLGSRDEGRGQAAADKLTAGGANVVMVPLDVTSDESVTDAVRLVRKHTGQLTVTEGTDPIIELATTGADGPTGTFVDRLGPVAW